MGDHDYSALLGRMRSRRITQETLAKIAGISATSMNLSLNNKREFRQNEIQSICEGLGIESTEISSYFFVPKLLFLEGPGGQDSA